MISGYEKEVAEIADLTMSLIRFRTTQDNPGEIRGCMDFIGEYLSARDIACRRVEHGGVPSILVMPVKNYAPVLLMSHVDVVAAPDALFDPREENGRLYGRGALDDKYAAALSLVLLKNRLESLRKAGGTLDDFPLGVLITGDEEVGGVNGAKAVLSEIRTDFCIALDGGTVDEIIVKEKGILTLRLITRGRTAHGSRPWQGENAIEKLIEDYSRIKRFFAETSPDHWHRALNFSIVRAGSSFNQVPDRAEAVFDIRYTENDNPDRLVADLAEAVSGTLEIEGKEPLFSAGESPWLDLLMDVADQSRPAFEHGASDARYLSQFGMCGVVWGADGDHSQHAADEHVDLASINRLYGYLDEFLDRCSYLSGVQVGGAE